MNLDISLILKAQKIDFATRGKNFSTCVKLTLGLGVGLHHVTTIALWTLSHVIFKMNQRNVGELAKRLEG